MDEQNKQAKKAEMINKAAEAMSQGAKKVDELVDKRSALGDLSAPITLGVVVMLVVALANNTNLVIYGLLGVAAGLAPKIIKMVMAKKAEMDAKKAAKSEEKK
jgi:hypothetical protein